MSKTIAFWLVIGLAMTLLAVVAWRFNPAPRICLDSVCYTIDP